MRVSKAGANAKRSAGMSGIRLKRGARRRKVPDRTAWCLSLKPYWGKPTVRNFRGGRLETWAMVGLGTRSAIERAESGNSRPKAARASALPDGDATSAARAVLQTGEFDFARNLPLDKDVRERLAHQGRKGAFHIVPGTLVTRLDLNRTDPWTEVEGEGISLRVPHPFFSDLRVR